MDSEIALRAILSVFREYLCSGIPYLSSTSPRHPPPPLSERGWTGDRNGNSLRTVSPIRHEVSLVWAPVHARADTSPAANSIHLVLVNPFNQLPTEQPLPLVDNNLLSRTAISIGSH